MQQNDSLANGYAQGTCWPDSAQGGSWRWAVRAVQASNSGQQLLLPPAEWRPTFFVPDHTGFVASGDFPLDPMKQLAEKQTVHWVPGSAAWVPCLGTQEERNFSMAAALPDGRLLLAGAGSPQHGLSSKTMALITSDCDAMRVHAHQMALITSDCVPYRRDRRGERCPPLSGGGVAVDETV